MENGRARITSIKVWVGIDDMLHRMLTRIVARVRVPMETMKSLYRQLSREIE